MCLWRHAPELHRLTEAGYAVPLLGHDKRVVLPLFEPVLDRLRLALRLPTDVEALHPFNLLLKLWIDVPVLYFLHFRQYLPMDSV